MNCNEYNANLILSSVCDGETGVTECGCKFREICGIGSEISYTEKSGEVILRICSERVEIERSGEISSLMVIEQDRTVNCCMHTLYGRMDIEVTGGEIRYTPAEDGCQAMFSYKSGAYKSEKQQTTITLAVKLF
jgi:uncharacterized beta-barrel protein YwiB (DUF1934 family)